MWEMKLLHLKIKNNMWSYDTTDIEFDDVQPTFTHLTSLRINLFINLYSFQPLIFVCFLFCV